MSRDEQERLRDIREAITTIRSHLANAGETTAAKEDPLLYDALLFQFVVVGEAVKHLAPETRESAANPAPAPFGEHGRRVRIGNELNPSLEVESPADSV